MGHQQQDGATGRRRLSAEFTNGLQCLEDADYAAALQLFRAAEAAAEIDDIFLNRYTSFHGLTRVLMGDESGVRLCRKATAGQLNDAEVFYNLALAEQRLGYRESAYMALRRGLRIAPEHSGLVRLKQELGLRDKHRLLAGLPRNHFLNRWLGRLLRGSRQPYRD
jgi:tetratricopeptide (TPR) repeat protein